MSKFKRLLHGNLLSSLESCFLVAMPTTTLREFVDLLLNGLLVCRCLSGDCKLPRRRPCPGASGFVQSCPKRIPIQPAVSQSGLKWGVSRITRRVLFA